MDVESKSSVRKKESFLNFTRKIKERKERKLPGETSPVRTEHAIGSQAKRNLLPYKRSLWEDFECGTSLL